MKLFHIGQTEIRLHIGLFIVLILAAIFGMLASLLQALLALTLHELSHAIVAHAMGYRIDVIEFLPYGGVARLYGQPMSNRADFVIALAGPLCSFLVAGGAALVGTVFPALYYKLQYFLSLNLALGMFNLLPALPLDGGRMLRAILGNFLRARLTTLVTAWLGVLFGAVLLAFSAYAFTRGTVNLFLLIMGVFLVLGAVKELRQAPQAQLTAILRRKDAFRRGEALPLKHVAVRESVCAGTALRQLSYSRYNLLQVLDEELNIIGQLDEGRLLSGIARYGQDITVGALLKR
ncbi:MAG TPA: M50 family metallopeptidase [Feifaniaceae bacterium]|nr:M50 family metallopeptidase [Feifaniaceae bacterium]